MGKLRKYLLEGNKPSTVILNTLTGVAASVPGWIPQIRLSKAKHYQWEEGVSGNPCYISDTHIGGDNHLNLNGTFDYPGRTGPYAEVNRMGPNDVATMHKIKAIFLGSLFAGLLGLNAVYTGVSYLAKKKAMKEVKGTKWERPVSEYLKKTYIPFFGKPTAENRLYKKLVEHYGLDAFDLPDGVRELYDQTGDVTKSIKERIKSVVKEDAAAPNVLLVLLNIKKPK
ncbi:MAG: hypothetical protein ACTSQE_15450 [Candidatus Heimdallarchaeaceae archaeon]